MVEEGTGSRRTTTERTPRGTARRAILGAPLEVIARHGLDAVTHRRVAELAGVSPGSTTHHFTSREELIRASFVHYVGLADRLLSRLDEEVRATVPDPAQRVIEVLVGVVRNEFGDERMVRAEYEMILFSAGDDELASHLRGWEAHWIGYLAGGLEAAGASRPVEGARILGNLLRGYELERLANPGLDEGDLRRRIEAILSALVTDS